MTIRSTTPAASPRWRRLVLWLHVLSSVGWMSQAVAMGTLTATAITTTDASTAVGAVSMAQVIDSRILAPMANVAAFTGFFLAITTPWGLTRHWWVLVKAAITVSQLYLGIFVLSRALDAATQAVHVGGARPSGWLTAAAAVMASAIAFQAWVSITKPWGPTPWAAGNRGTRAAGTRAAGTRRPPKLPAAPSWLMRLGVAAPVTDLAVGAALGFPMPAFSLVVLVVAGVHRRRSTRRPRRPATDPSAADSVVAPRV